MQYRFLGDVELPQTTKKIFEQQEVWTLTAVLDYAKKDLNLAAELFGCSKTTFIDRLKKYKLVPNDWFSDII